MLPLRDLHLGTGRCGLLQAVDMAIGMGRHLGGHQKTGGIHGRHLGLCASMAAVALRLLRH